jgi:hypothetical protein
MGTCRPCLCKGGVVPLYKSPSGGRLRLPPNPQIASKCEIEISKSAAFGASTKRGMFPNAMPENGRVQLLSCACNARNDTFLNAVLQYMDRHNAIGELIEMLGELDPKSLSTLLQWASPFGHTDVMEIVAYYCSPSERRKLAEMIVEKMNPDDIKNLAEKQMESEYIPGSNAKNTWNDWRKKLLAKANGHDTMSGFPQYFEKQFVEILVSIIEPPLTLL